MNVRLSGLCSVGGVVCQAVELTEETLQVRDSASNAVIHSSLLHDVVVLDVGAPEQPARVKMSGGKELRIRYCGTALDDFLFVLGVYKKKKEGEAEKDNIIKTTSSSSSSSSSFYGWQDPSWKAHLLRLNKNNSSSSAAADLRGPYSRLADAQQVSALKPSQALRVWGKEKKGGSSSASREFFLASYEEFLDFYFPLISKLSHGNDEDLDECCFYEMISDGAPCKLYLDVEFPLPHPGGEHHQGDDVIHTLLLHLTSFLHMHQMIKRGGRGEREKKKKKTSSTSSSSSVETEGKKRKVDEKDDCDHLGVDDSDIPAHIMLESTYENKFSRHVIFPDLVFCNNVAMGHMMRAFHGYMSHLSSPQAKSCFFPNFSSSSSSSSSNLSSFVCDLAVYSRNRNFRLCFSSKRGKRSPLLPIPRLSTSSSSKADLDFFLRQSLVSHIQGSDNNMYLLSFDAPNDNTYAPHRISAAALKGSPFFSPSPFPLLDDYVKARVTPDGGFVRSAVFFSATNTVVYNIGGSHRYCANIGRHHKSNGVYFVVDVKKKTIVQRCYDPDCKGVSSQPQMVPLSCLMPTSWESNGELISKKIRGGELLPDEELLTMLQAFSEKDHGLLPDDVLLQACAELGIP